MKERVVQMTITVIAAVLLAWTAAAQNPMLQELENSFVRLNEEVRPSVVNIEVKSSAPEEGRQMEDLFRFFGWPVPEEGMPQPMPRQGTGSGFLLDKQGHIVTNNHVVSDAYSISVRLWNGDEYDAEVIGRDPDTDLAVIKIEPRGDLPIARLGDSDALKVGQFAVALGSPRGFEGSLSFGHISALGRENLAGLAVQGLRFQNLIQTDAAINLGNSGGPLCNIEGEVIGINVAILYGANSIGFAIPINTAKEIVPELIANKKITRGYIGVQISDAKDFASAVGLPDADGAFVKGVQEGTPAETAGLKYYDVIRKVNGKPVKNSHELVSTISSFDPGTEVTLDVWRDGKDQQIKVVLGEWNPDEETVMPSKDSQVLGMTVRALTPDVVERMGLEPDTSGVIITQVEPGSPADAANLMHGDIIIEVARNEVTDVASFRALVNKHSTPGGSLLIRYVRGNNQADITVLKVPQETAE